MNSNVRKILCLAAAFVLMLGTVGFAVPVQAEERDGYAGNAYIPVEGDDCVLYDVDGAGTDSATAFGIDVSHHQGTIDWDTVAPQIDFAILRCGYGDDLPSYDDRQWYANADACTRLGIPFGVYIYSYAFTDEEALSEAQHVLRLIEGYDPTLPIYLDLEDSSILANCSTDDILRHATIFCDTIEEAGYNVGIYANYYWWTNYLTAPEYDQWDRWIARYASATGYTKDYSMWQYSSTGSIDGINVDVDLNYWYGDFPTETAAIQVGNVSGNPGETVRIPVNISNNPGFAGFTFAVNYDSSVMMLTDISGGELLKASDSGILTKNVDDNTVTWADTQNTTGSGNILYLTFALQEEAADGTYNVSIGLKDGSSTNFADENSQTKKVKFCEGLVEVTRHVYNYSVTQAPTVEAAGVLTGTCSDCGNSTVVILPKLNDADYTYTVTAAASCTQAGSALYTWNTTSYGDYSFEVTLAQTTHSYGEWTVTKVPTAWESGEETRSCIHCGKDEKRSIDKLSNPFVDVFEKDYYYDSALWAYHSAITVGDGASNTFNPNGLCKRNQVVTFLWRAAGSPEPAETKSPFTDVQKGDYFYKAVLWAVEKGITVGMEADRFGPEQSCTRAQVAAFLWRYAGEPKHSAAANPFQDVAQAEYYYDAVLWAAENGITEGDGSAATFNPDGKCTRAQIVTFLYRFMG